MECPIEALISTGDMSIWVDVGYERQPSLAQPGGGYERPPPARPALSYRWMAQMHS